ncbi:hypothetical protein QQF64_024332 [Cirrhinus molitorella]|uniref:WW domain-containing protein n=1 Tax=Cirrhinus molitorella TaxID=172907 RepID=A0ABR3NL44_9TELE
MQQPVVSCSMPAEEIESVCLPVGWKSYRSPEGRKYYVNTSTKETTWERPSTSTTSPKASGSHRHSVNGRQLLGASGHVLEHPDVSLRKTSLSNQSLISGQDWKGVGFKRSWEGLDREDEGRWGAEQLPIGTG